ncbi:MAG: hypothetical protein IPP13_20830 [Kouleothrix sp.]|jgi:hypothetical protein|nr:hypothetical protein [Kouleothrix sp.]
MLRPNIVRRALPGGTGRATWLARYGKAAIMSIPEHLPPDQTMAVYRHHERLYRLALLVAGAPKAAAALVESAYRRLPAGLPAEQVEASLIRGLLGSRALRRRRGVAPPADLSRTTLDRDHAAALLQVLAALPPPARLCVGLAYLVGSTPTDSAAMLGDTVGDCNIAELLAGFRISAARVLELVPAEAQPAALARVERWADGRADADEQLAIRRDLLAQPELRAIRDGLLATRELLPRAIPALFAAAPPLDLTERLLKLARPRPARLPLISARRAQALLVLGVLLLAAAIVVLPSLAARPRPPAATAGSASPRDLVEAAIHRFDRPALTQGILHEIYRVDQGGRAGLLIERWYDYAAPNRLAIRITEEGTQSPPLLQISSDGRSQAQFRYNHTYDFGDESVDIQLSEAEAQAIMPLLRSQPIASAFTRNSSAPSDPGPLFLAQARAAGVSLLGNTSLLGRPAVLLTYQTNRPPQPQSQPLDQPARVVLTIDTQTYALLEVSVIAAGQGEGASQNPIRAQLFEVLPADSAAPFTLAPEPGVARRIGVTSIHFPFIDSTQQLTLEDAAQRMPNQLFAPLALPDTHMRGVAIKNGGSDSADDIVLLYEGEFQNVIVLPNFAPNDSQELGAEQVAGEFRYRLVRRASFEGSLIAQVYRPGAPEQSLGLILNDDLATDDERQARLAAMIESLTLVNDQSLPALRRTFQPPGTAGGT